MSNFDPRLKLVLGPPGTGKTTRLLNIAEEEMAGGVMPNQIAFVTFTRKGAEEAMTRAKTKFKLSNKDLPYFRTLHSLAFRELGLTKQQTMTKQQLAQLGEALRLNFGKPGAMPGPRDSLGGKYLRIMDMARANGVSTDAIRWKYPDVDTADWGGLHQFIRSYEQYKTDLGLWDYTDMIHGAATEVPPLDIKVAIIDEAQDLNMAQWRMAQHVFSRAQRVYIAGDDDQAIYRWNGAAVDHFIGLRGEQEVLGRSYRLTAPVYNTAVGVLRRIRNRFSKDWRPRPGPGSVNRLSSINHLRELVLNGDSWMFIAPTSYQLGAMRSFLYQTGVPFTDGQRKSVNSKAIKAIMAWQRLLRGEAIPQPHARLVCDNLSIRRDLTRDTYTMAQLGPPTTEQWYDAFVGIKPQIRAYYRMCLRNGQDVLGDTAVHLSTIHQVKGGEADNVVLATDITPRVAEMHRTFPDDLHRLMYVGVSRAKHNLFLFGHSDRDQYTI